MCHKINYLKVFLLFVFILMFPDCFLGQKTSSTSGKDSLSYTKLNRDSIRVDSIILTGSSTLLDSGTFQRGIWISPEQLMKARIPGLVMTTENGPKGRSSHYSMRGASSGYFRETPLFVVDGFILNSINMEGMRNPLNLVHPKDIESITFLKDGPETSIYGSRAANGVVLIKTKRSNSSEKIQLNYESVASYTDISDNYDVYSANKFRSVIEDKFEASPDAMNYLGDANTSWQREIYNNHFNINHYLSIQGSLFNRKLPYRIAYGYNQNNGILKTSSFDRNTLTLKAHPSFFHDHLKVGVQLRGMDTENRFAKWQATQNALMFNPTRPVYSDQEEFGGYYTQTDDSNTPILTAPQNPVALLEQTDESYHVKRYLSNFSLSYNFHFLPKLGVRVRYGMDRTNSSGNYKVSTDAAWVKGGKNYEKIVVYKNQFFQTALNYSEYIKSLKSGFQLRFSMERQIFNEINEKRIPDDSNSETNSSFKNSQESQLGAVWGRLKYHYDQKYFLDFALREDKASYFDYENRQSLYPGVGLSWNMHHEPFLENIKFLSKLEMRMSHSVTGSNSFLQEVSGVTIDQNIYSPETNSENIGLDYGLYDNKVTGSVDVYSRTTRDIPLYLPVPSGTNLYDRVLTDAGNIKNNGFELSLNTSLELSQKLSWKFSIGFAYNKNRLSNLNFENNSLGLSTGSIEGGIGNKIQIISEGYPVNSFYAYKQVYDQNGNPIEGVYTDQNDDDVYDIDDRFIGKTSEPNSTFSLTNRFVYNRLEVVFLIRGRMGNYVYNNVASYFSPYSRMYDPSGFLRNRIDTDVNHFEKSQYYSDYYIENGSFLKMDYFSVGYTFDLSEKNDSKLRVYSVVRNPFLLTKYNGLDPEVNNGIDYNAYPSTTTYMLGIALDM